MYKEPSPKLRIAYFCKHMIMKRSILFLAAAAFTSFGAAGQPSLPPVDKSPLDILYYPLRYPNLKVQEKVTEPLTARVIYSRPKKEGRDIFGGLVSYGKLWRLGANEATEVSFNRDVSVNGTAVKAGKYSMYAIPGPDSFEIALNSETGKWGAFEPDLSLDVMRTNVATEKLPNPVEQYTISLDEARNGIDMIFEWSDTRFVVPVR